MSTWAFALARRFTARRSDYRSIYVIYAFLMNGFLMPSPPLSRLPRRRPMKAALMAFCRAGYSWFLSDFMLIYRFPFPLAASALQSSVIATQHLTPPPAGHISFGRRRSSVLPDFACLAVRMPGQEWAV